MNWRIPFVLGLILMASVISFRYPGLGGVTVVGCLLLTAGFLLGRAR